MAHFGVYFQALCKLYTAPPSSPRQRANSSTDERGMTWEDSGGPSGHGMGIALTGARFHGASEKRCGKTLLPSVAKPIGGEQAMPMGR